MQPHTGTPDRNARTVAPKSSSRRSCKTRGFCASCSTKRALLWAEFVQEKVFKPVDHRHVVFILPEMLRPLFKFHRDLLPKLCPCPSDAMREYFKASISKHAMAGAILAINTACEFLNWQTHCHGVVTCGGFLPNGDFESAPTIDAKTVRETFEAKVFSIVLENGLIGDELLEKIRSVEPHRVRPMDWPSDHRHEGDRADRYVHSASAGSVRSTDRR